MEKLRNILSPGHAKDDAVLYGNENPDQQFINKGAVSGAGSHFPVTKSTGDDVDRATTAGTFDPASYRTPGAFVDDDADAATTASIKSGVPGESQSGPLTGGLSRDLNKPAAGSSTLDKPNQNPHSTLPSQTPAVSQYDSTTSKPSHGQTVSSLTSLTPRDTGTALPPTTQAGTSQTGATTSSKDPSLVAPVVGEALYRGTEQTGHSGAAPQAVGKTTLAALGPEYGGTNVGSKTTAEPIIPGSGSAPAHNTAGTHAHSGPLATSSGASSGLGNTAGTHSSSGPLAAPSGASSGQGDNLGTHTHVHSDPSATASGAKSGTEDSSAGRDVVGFCDPSEPPSSYALPESHNTETAKRLDPKYHGSESAITPASTLSGSQTESSGLRQSTTTPSSQGFGTAQGTVGASSANSQTASQDPAIGIASTSGAGSISATGATSNYPSSGTETKHHDHLTRDAALFGSAGAGTAGLATHASHKDSPLLSGVKSSNADTYKEPISGSTNSAHQSQAAQNPPTLSSSAQSGTGLPAYERSALDPVPSSNRGRDAGFNESTATDLPTEHGHSSARDKAILGGAAGGVGAGGFAAYEAGKDPKSGNSGVGSHDQGTPGGLTSRFEEHDTTPSGTAFGGSGNTASHDYGKGTSSVAPVTGSSYEPVTGSQPVQTDDHSTRNKALLGGAGGGAVVGAGGFAAYESKKHNGSDLAGADSNLTQQPHQGTTAAAAPLHDSKEAKKLEKEHEKDVKQVEKQHDKEVKKLEKEHDKDVKAIAKEHTHDQKKAEKEAHKEEEKAMKKEEKEHDKQAAIIAKEHKKEDKKHEKLAEKEHGEKKPSLVHRLLHRHDDEKAVEKEHQHQEQGLHDPDSGRPPHPSNPQDAAERSTSNEADYIGSNKTTHDAYNSSEGHNKLHKKNAPGNVLDQQGGSSSLQHDL